jgi:hypothetical protein
MFTNISWGNYTIAVALLVAGWYLFVGLRFYFDELKAIVTGKLQLQFQGLGKTNSQNPSSELNYQDSVESTSTQSSFEAFDTTYQDVNALVERLKMVIADAAKREPHKQEFLDYLQLILREYPTVKDSPFNSSVSELIVKQCSELDFITVTQREAEALWN